MPFRVLMSVYSSGLVISSSSSFWSFSSSAMVIILCYNNYFACPHLLQIDARKLLQLYSLCKGSQVALHYRIWTSTKYRETLVVENFGKKQAKSRYFGKSKHSLRLFSNCTNNWQIKLWLMIISNHQIWWSFLLPRLPAYTVIPIFNRVMCPLLYHVNLEACWKYSNKAVTQIQQPCMYNDSNRTVAIKKYIMNY